LRLPKYGLNSLLINLNFQFGSWGKKACVCGCEVTVAGKGGHTLAFVRVADYLVKQAEQPYDILKFAAISQK
jgi:hypothetical protein